MSYLLCKVQFRSICLNMKHNQAYLNDTSFFITGERESIKFYPYITACVINFRMIQNS